MNINYSSDYTKNSKLFRILDDIHAQDLAGPGSVLTNYLNEQGITMADDLADVDAADVADALAKKLEKDSEESYEKRDNIIKPAFKNHRKCVQYVKGLKRGKVHELGDWGQTVDGTNRIVYPTDFFGVKKCIKDFIAKHNTFPVGTSPLQPFLDANPDIDLAQTLLDLADAETHHNDAGQYARDAEEQYELRDLKFDPVYQHILGIGQFLIKTFPSTPRKLGRWGYEVDEASRTEKQRNIQVAQSSLKTVYKAVQGTLVKNNSPFAVEVYAGKTTDGTPIVLGSNEGMTIKFRFGTFTVKNNNPLDSANLSATTYDN